MNKASFLIAFFAVLILLQDSLYACTSFAVYSKQVYYGMNFDFQNLPMKFLISVNGDIRTFHLAFERTIGGVKFFANTAAMNNRGLFAACQELRPINENPPAKTDDNMFTFELYNAVEHFGSVKEILRLCRKRPIVDMPGVTLHNFFADAGGDAAVTEPGEKATAVSEIEGNYIVMTNFSNRTMAGRSYLEAEGMGKDRYIIAHRYLKEHSSHFTIENGFELLSLTRNRDPKYPTICSMVFDPGKREIYIVMHGVFARIMKLSIESGVIEAWRGYENEHRLTVPAGDEGVVAGDVAELFFQNPPVDPNRQSSNGSTRYQTPNNEG